MCTSSIQEIENSSKSHRETWKKIRALLKSNIAKDDSNRLFESVIKKMQWFYDQTGSLDDIEAFYYAEASRRVNSYKSSFYLYGEQDEEEQV